VDTREAARRWAETWRRGWEALDPEEIVELYADDCLFLSYPFRAPEPPHEYVRRALAEADWAKPWFGEPVVEDDRAAVEWWAASSEEGREITLAGVSLLRFDRDGRCIEQRDTWALEEGRVERP
jgi:SnoaL-like domain